jgi:hypothetical protein
MSDQKQPTATLKALRAEAKKTGVKNYSKLSRDFLIDAIKEKQEQNNISDAVKIVFDTTLPEAKGEPEPVPPVPTIPPPSTPEKKERKTRKKKDPDAPKKERKTAGPNKWQLHVQAFRSEHPELSYKNAMIEAKKTYQA